MPIARKVDLSGQVQRVELVLRDTNAKRIDIYLTTWITWRRAINEMNPALLCGRYGQGSQEAGTLSYYSD